MSDRDNLLSRSRTILERHWQPEGYTVPNLDVYPHQWLWDSCFHAIAWAALGDADRALTELTNVFAHQADDGFVPHMTYWRAPDLHADFWGRRATSSITQPPMYGHALAELHRRGVAVPTDLLGRAEAGIRFLTEKRPHLVHPWESGCDDSPRWDAWCPDGWTASRWKQVKGELVAAIGFDPITASPVGSRRFEVRSAGFDALVAFNAAELATVSNRPIDVPAVAFDEPRWRPDRHTWADWPGPPGGDEGGWPPRSSADVRTLDALLPVLVVPPGRHEVDEVFEQLLDPFELGGRFGPAAVHRSEPAFDPTTYWRGPSWPQLTYLFWVAARRHGRDGDAVALADRLVAGAVRSGFAEYWHPDTGEGFGAAPQSWATLAAVVLDPPAAPSR